MATIEDPDFAARFPARSAPGKGPVDPPPFLAWVGVYLPNLIIPVYFARMICNEPAMVGMVFGVLVVFGVGCRACFRSRRLMLAIIYGGWVVGASQFLPMLQMFAGSFAVGGVAALGLTTSGRAEDVNTAAGGFVATLITGALLLAVAASFGLILGWVGGVFFGRAPRVAKGVDPEV